MIGQDQDQDALAPGAVIEGRYVVEALIGRGGMASVYRVRHVHLDTQHALKVLTVGGASLQRRLHQEGRVQAKLQHPNIVAVTDMVSVEGAPGLVMEFVGGPSLEGLLVRRQPDLAQIDVLALGILDGVAAAHAVGLIHRDLKPANVMVAVTSNTLVPKVADFGLVKLVAGEEGGVMSRTRSGMAMGTPAYMAPEQIEDAKHVDVRADVWSLGAILFELATGQRAFDGANVLSLFLKVSQGDRAKVREVAPHLPDRMVEAIEGALQVNLDRRIPDVRTLRSKWLQGAILPTEPPFDADWLTLASGMGAGGEDTRDFLERSFRTGNARPAPIPAVVRDPARPVVPPAEASTWIDEGNPTAVPLAGATTVAPDLSLAPATLAPNATLGETLTVETPQPRARRPVVLGAGGLLLLVAVGLVGTWVATRPAPVVPAPAPVVVPVASPPTAPSPPPAVAPDPVVPVPTPTVAPTPVSPAPAPVRPAPAVVAPAQDPGPEVVPAPVAPVPVPVPVVPAGPAGFRIAADRGLTVVVRDASGRRVANPKALPEGQYTVVAFFHPDQPDKGDEFGPFQLGPGQVLAVECLQRRFDCRIQSP